MERQVVFYRLSRKVVNDRDAIPEDARQVLYYSLAIGHHVGVMDCFAELMAVPAEAVRPMCGPAASRRGSPQAAGRARLG